jgi:pyroglutamyl-peptidase
MKDKVLFHITGFSEFHGVLENPTKTLVEKLRNYLESNPIQYYENLNICSCSVVEVSAVGSLFSLCELLQSHSRCIQAAEEQSTTMIWLHLVLSGDSKAFHLERLAWNEATFRTADERGWRPDRQLIIRSNQSLFHALETTFPLAILHQRLQRKNYQVNVSDDPGRFVCNWLYYHSLYFSKLNNSKCLFIHVPPFEAISCEAQLNFLGDLINLLTELEITS